MSRFLQESRPLMDTSTSHAQAAFPGKMLLQGNFPQQPICEMNSGNKTGKYTKEAAASWKQ